MSNKRWIDMPGAKIVPDKEIKKLRASHREKFPFLQQNKEAKL